MIWTKSKINYVFVFEFDTRSALDWRQLLEVRAASLVADVAHTGSYLR